MSAVKNNTYNTGTIPTRISIFCLDSASIVFKRLQTVYFLRPPKTATWSLSLIFLLICVVIYTLVRSCQYFSHWPYPQTTVKQSGYCSRYSLLFNAYCIIAWKCVFIFLLQITDRNFNIDLDGDRQLKTFPAPIRGAAA